MLFDGVGVGARWLSWCGSWGVPAVGVGLGPCCPSGCGCQGVLSVGCENRGVLPGLGGWPCTAVVRAALGGLARPTGSAADSPTARRRVRCAHARLPALAPSRSPAPRDLPTRPGPGALPQAAGASGPGPAGRLPATCRLRPAAPPPGVPGTPPTTAHTLADLRLVPRGTPWNASVRRPSPVRRRSPPGQVPAVRGARAVREPRTAPRPHGPTAARGPCRRAGARGHRAGQAPAPPPGRPRERTGE